MPSTIHSHLVVPGIRCQARIGWSEAERAVSQDVVVAIALEFSVAPTATASDQLAETVDYAALTRTVVSICGSGPYALLERLGHVLYVGLREALSRDTRLFLEVAKLRSPLAELERSARFGLGDWRGAFMLTSAHRNSTTP